MMQHWAWMIAGGLMVMSMGCGGGSTSNPSAPNTPPTANLSLELPSPTIGKEMTLDATSSTDPNGDSLQYLIRVVAPSGDEAARVESQEGSLTFTPEQSGTYLVTATVTDGNGGKDTVARTFKTRNQAPEVVTSWSLLDNNGEEVESASETTQGVTAFGAFGEIVVEVEEVRDPDGHDVGEVEWVVDEAPAQLNYKMRNSMGLRAVFPDNPLFYRIRAVVEDEYGKRGGPEFRIDLTNP